MDKKVILAIESSCDETAAAVVVNGREVLSNIISSQSSSRGCIKKAHRSYKCSGRRSFRSCRSNI